MQSETAKLPEGSSSPWVAGVHQGPGEIRVMRVPDLDSSGTRSGECGTTHWKRQAWDGVERRRCCGFTPAELRDGLAAFVVGVLFLAVVFLVVLPKAI